MNTIYTAQKQTNLTTFLLQDIPVFHGHDATWLEDWLTDIEMAADLTNKSRTNLAKTKSRGLTCTLIIEAITLDKSWEDIKDFLRLKLCNADIHTYILHFMEIQQWENESLTAYIHWSKTEARRCNFTSSATTIRIFIKGLKNTHDLAHTSTRKDHKPPQMLYPKLRDFRLQNTSYPCSFHLPWSLFCLKKKITVFSARNRVI